MEDTSPRLEKLLKLQRRYPSGSLRAGEESVSLQSSHNSGGLSDTTGTLSLSLTTSSAATECDFLVPSDGWQSKKLGALALR